MNCIKKMIVTAAIVVLPCLSCQAAGADAPILHSPVMTAEHINVSD